MNVSNIETETKTEYIPPNEIKNTDKQEHVIMPEDNERKASIHHEIVN
jgi:hypothetical protein